MENYEPIDVLASGGCINVVVATPVTTINPEDAKGPVIKAAQTLETLHPDGRKDVTVYIPKMDLRGKVRRMNQQGG